MYTAYIMSVIICSMVATAELLRGVVCDEYSTLTKFAIINLLRFTLAMIPILNIVFFIYVIVKRWMPRKQINWKWFLKNYKTC